ncbi:amidase family protein [Gemmatimonas phototrophica]|uniref:amidase family protein n=1 Tax=Gemmatimonas phototrophica TaxID=1379270 RepID=UPI0006A6D360|nr:amidase family protein [Gemmatimonas phototrophica]
MRHLSQALLFAAVTATSANAQPAKPLEVTEATVTQLQQAMAEGRATSVSITRAYLARIAAYDQAGPRLNAIIRLNPRALQQAAALDAERRAGKVRGPLHGVPIILKDNYDTGDMPTSAGSLALATSQPARDGFVVQRLRDAGAIVLAKANMHELAAGITNISSLGGQTRNPYDPARCPGGSSGGTGAAIAASFATIGWGSDTCGSIRIPSAFGSLVGLRPTIGMVSRTGIIPLSHTQDIGGPLARTVTDLAIALDISVAYDSADATTESVRTGRAKFLPALNRDALRGTRIGLFLPYLRDTDSEIADSVRAAMAVMTKLGATVVEVPMAEFDTLIANTSVINMETKGDLAAYLAGVPNAPVKSIGDIVRRGQFDRELEVRFRSADTFPALPNAAHTTTLARQQALRARVEYLLDSLKLSAFAYPTVRQKPVFPGQVQPGSTCPLGAQSGLPSIAMPAGFTSDGLPVSVELLGKGFSDVDLVSYAYAFEQAGPRRRAPSTTPALVNGAAPVTRPLTITARSGSATVTTLLTIDAVHNELRWTVRTSMPNQITAVVLRRQGGGTLTGPASGTIGSAPVMARMTIPSEALRVVARLMGPNRTTASGSLPLSYADRVAFAEKRLSIAVMSSTGLVAEEIVK